MSIVILCNCTTLRLISDCLNITEREFYFTFSWGSTYFRGGGGPYISEIYGLGGPNISKYMDRGEQKRGSKFVVTGPEL